MILDKKLLNAKGSGNLYVQFSCKNYSISVTLDKREETIFFLIKNMASKNISFRNCKELKVVLYSNIQSTVYIQDHQLVLVGDRFMFNCSAIQNFYGFEYIYYILLYFNPK